MTCVRLFSYVWKHLCTGNQNYYVHLDIVVLKGQMLVGNRMDFNKIPYY